MQVTRKMVEDYINKNVGPYSLGAFKLMLSTLGHYGTRQFSSEAWNYINQQFPFHVTYYKQEGYIK